ncbi:hypothetical protein OROGR_017791 [Orobanche gracilis]
MWKKKLYNSTHIAAILSRAASSTDPSSSNSISRCCNPSIFKSRSFSSSSSCFLEGNPFPSARGLSFPTSLSSIVRRDNLNLFLRNENFFCSQSKSAEKCHCWSCGAEAENSTPFLFCRACRGVQPVDESIDYFQIFGLSMSFMEKTDVVLSGVKDWNSSFCLYRGREYSLEVEELEKKYKDWQKKLHPDLVHSKSQREREYASEQSARVIDAYRTLTDPLLRAIYILLIVQVVPYFIIHYNVINIF